MATVLQVCRLRVRTRAGWQDPYDLDRPVVAIVGPVDTGKSSLLGCIAFGMGRDIGVFRGVVDQHLLEVEVVIRVGPGEYSLRRARRSQSFIDVSDAMGTAQGRFPVRGRPGQRTFSDWILEQLGMADDVAAVRLPGGRALDFADGILPYCYLTQTDIGRHVVRSPRDEAARLASLRLMLNLTSAKVERLAATIREVDNDIDREGRRLRTISEFLSQSAGTNQDSLQAEMDQLAQVEFSATEVLATLRAKAVASSPVGDPIRYSLVAARQRVADAEDAFDEAVRRRMAVSHQLGLVQESLAALDDMDAGSLDNRSTLRLAFPRCPACEADISARLAPPGSCYMCHERLAGGDHRIERQRLTGAQQDLDAELAGLDASLTGAERDADRARRDLAELLARLDVATGPTVSPYVEEIAAATAELADVRASLAVLSRLLDTHRRLRDQYDHLGELEGEQRARREKLVQGPDLEPIDDVIARLNAIFEGIVSGVGLPNATGPARIDPDSLLPLVDEQPDGGARAAVSVAYSLTLLTYTLENGLATIPGLLLIDSPQRLIDSPQKSVGADRDDRALVHRVYERFLDYVEDQMTWRRGHFRRPFQLIIVDNDLHHDIRRRIRVHQFSDSDGFIKGLPAFDDSPPALQLELGDATTDR